MHGSLTSKRIEFLCKAMWFTVIRPCSNVNKNSHCRATWLKCLPLLRPNIMKLPFSTVRELLILINDKQQPGSERASTAIQPLLFHVLRGEHAPSFDVKMRFNVASHERSLQVLTSFFGCFLVTLSHSAMERVNHFQML